MIADLSRSRKLAAQSPESGPPAQSAIGEDRRAGEGQNNKGGDKSECEHRNIFLSNPIRKSWVVDRPFDSLWTVCG